MSAQGGIGQAYKWDSGKHSFLKHHAQGLLLGFCYLLPPSVGRIKRAGTSTTKCPAEQGPGPPLPEHFQTLPLSSCVQLTWKYSSSSSDSSGPILTGRKGESGFARSHPAEHRTHTFSLHHPTDTSLTSCTNVITSLTKPLHLFEKLVSSSRCTAENRN